MLSLSEVLISGTLWGIRVREVVVACRVRMLVVVTLLLGWNSEATSVINVQKVALKFFECQEGFVINSVRRMLASKCW